MKIKAFLFVILTTLLSFSQNKNQTNTKPILVTKSQPVKFIQPLGGRILIPVENTKKEYRDKLWTNYPTNFNALPKGGDPLAQNKMGKIPGKAPIESFVGATVTQGSGFPPDPTGAVGPNHYIHSYNTGFAIFDKQGNVLLPHASLSNLFPGESLGDPIVMYDRYADRFIVTEFSNSPDGFLVAVSLGPDPVNDGWATYRFEIDAFPDYPKYSIWHDGYYITANKFSGNVIYVLNRDQMIAAEPTADIVGFGLPGVNPNTNTVFSPLAMNSVGPNLPDSNTPGYITYLQDDAWATGPDHLKIWEVTVDWETPSNSDISTPIQLNTTPFDSFLQSFGIGEVPQPNTATKLDAQTGIVSYMCNYWAFDDHNSVTLNFNVDVSGNNSRTGIRWFELRDNNGNWNIEQEGTFSPNDGLWRFMGSMHMDHFGNIGLAYSRGNANNFTSLYYTGRYANDAPGEMTINEELIVQGNGSQNLRRYGDYSQLTLDPLNDKTFWFTSEYFEPNGWRTRIASFQLAPTTTNDVGVISIDQPIDATFTNAEEVTVTIFNFGENPQSNFPISLSLDNTLIANEVFSGTIAPSSTAQYTFTATVDMSIIQQTYTISAQTNLVNDDDTFNDAASKQVTHIDPRDLGITAIVAPTSNANLGTETITVTIKNYGGEDQSNFDVSYTLNGNTITENISGTVVVGGTLDFNFNIQGDFSTLGNHELSAKTLLVNDGVATNNEFSTIIRNISCIPSALPAPGTNEQGCGLDGIKKFILGEIDADNGGSGCNTEGGSGVLGYADRTNLSTDLDRSQSQLLIHVQHNWDGGNNGPEKMSVWVDLDDNGLFDADEQLMAGITFPADNVPVTFLFPLPDDAALGTHILRIRVIDTSSTPGDINDPCADYHFGETQDYTITVTDTTLSTDDLLLNETEMTIATLDDNQFKVALPTNLITETLVISLHNALGQKVVKNRVENINGSYSYKLDLNGLSPGVYLVRLGNAEIGKVKRIIVK